MKEKINSISAIWWSDKKTVEECANRVYDFFLLLKDYNDLFDRWFEKGYSKKEALKNEISIEQDYFYKDLNRKWDKKFDDLGARVSYWTGHDEETKSAEIAFSIGAYGDKSFNKNSCVITLPEEYDDGNQSEHQGLIKLMKDYWKPDKLLINGETIENLDAII